MWPFLKQSVGGEVRLNLKEGGENFFFPSFWGVFARLSVPVLYFGDSMFDFSFGGRFFLLKFFSGFLNSRKYHQINVAVVRRKYSM
jgi:hypothetical protein